MIPTIFLWITICSISCIENMDAQGDVENFEFWQGLMFRANLAREAVTARENLAVKSEKPIYIFQL
jgi:hypothetical protein